MNTEKMELNDWFAALETTVPRIKSEPGYFKHVPLTALKLVKWIRHYQKLANANMKKNDGHLIFTNFDTETTGLANKEAFGLGKAGITDIGALKIIDGKYYGNNIDKNGIQDQVDNEYEFQTLVNPGVLIPNEVQEITHITNVMIENAPSQRKALSKFKEFSKDTILLGHNIGDSIQNKSGYDLNTVLGPIYNRYWNQNPESLLQNSIDTLPLFSGLVAGVKHNNASFAKLFGIKLVGAHRAIPDVRVNALAFSKIAELMLRVDVDELEAFANKKLDSRNFMLTLIRPGAEIRKGVQHNWAELFIAMDKKYNIGRKRNRIMVKYDFDTKQFEYPKVMLNDGVVAPANEVRKDLPISLLKRQVQLFTKKVGFKSAIEQYNHNVF